MPTSIKHNTKYEIAFPGKFTKDAWIHLSSAQVFDLLVFLLGILSQQQCLPSLIFNLPETHLLQTLKRRWTAFQSLSVKHILFLMEQWNGTAATLAFGSSRHSTCLIYSIRFPCCGQVISSYCFPTITHLYEWLQVFFSWNYILNRSSACYKTLQKAYPSCKDKKEKSWNL